MTPHLATVNEQFGFVMSVLQKNRVTFRPQETASMPYFCKSETLINILSIAEHSRNFAGEFIIVLKLNEVIDFCSC